MPDFAEAESGIPLLQKPNNDKKVVLRWNRVGESVYKTMDLNFGMAFRG